MPLYFIFFVQYVCPIFSFAIAQDDRRGEESRGREGRTSDGDFCSRAEYVVVYQVSNGGMVTILQNTADGKKARAKRARTKQNQLPGGTTTKEKCRRIKVNESEYYIKIGRGPRTHTHTHGRRRQDTRRHTDRTHKKEDA